MRQHRGNDALALLQLTKALYQILHQLSLAKRLNSLDMRVKYSIYSYASTAFAQAYLLQCMKVILDSSGQRELMQPG
jgi:hypothetical protein